MDVLKYQSLYEPLHAMDMEVEGGGLFGDGTGDDLLLWLWWW